MRSTVVTAVSQTVEEKPGTRKRLSHPAPPERVVQILQERPRVVHVRAAQHDLDAAAGIQLGDLRRLLVGRAPRDETTTGRQIVCNCARAREAAHRMRAAMVSARGATAVLPW